MRRHGPAVHDPVAAHDDQFLGEVGDGAGVDRDHLQVDYEVGGSKEAMQFRNMSRVIPGDVLKMGPDTCVITLLTWRLQTQTDAEWTQFGTIHEAEMFLIKGLLERE